MYKVTLEKFIFRPFLLKFNVNYFLHYFGLFFKPNGLFVVIFVYVVSVMVYGVNSQNQKP